MTHPVFEAKQCRGHAGYPMCPLSRNGTILAAANAPAHLQIDLQISGQRTDRPPLTRRISKRGADIAAPDRLLYDKNCSTVRYPTAVNRKSD